MTNRISEKQNELEGDLVGKLLIESPFLARDQFSRSVLLILQNNNSGTFGINLNQPADLATVNAWKEMTGKPFSDNSMVKGGPHGGPVFAIHPFKKIAELTLAGGVYVSANSKFLDQLSNAPDSSYRIVFGIANWDIGTLLDEIGNGSWLVTNVILEDIFDDPKMIWENCFRRYGRQTFCDVTGIPELPKSTPMN